MKSGEVVFLLKFAWKNLTRHKRRTVITAVALAFGLLLFIVMDSLLAGMFKESNNNLKNAETGDGKIISVEAFEDLKYLPLNNRVENPDEIIKLVERYGGKASRRVLANGDMIFTEEYFPLSGSTPILFTGVDLKSDNNAFNIFRKRNLVDGRFMNRGIEEIVIGSWLAEDINAEVGDWCTLSLRTAADGDDPGFIQTIDVEIVGIIKVDNPIINRKVVYFPLDVADYYMDLYGSVTEISVRVPFGESLQSFKERINRDLKDNLKFYTWKEIASDYVKMLEMETGSSSIIIILIILIALVGITNTMLMTINERERELGMMRALGMSDSHIRISFLFEAAGIGFTGSLLGVVLGILTNIPLVNTGIDYSMWLRDSDMGYRISSYIKGAWNFSTIVIAFIMGIMIPVFISLFPTRKATQKSIPDCLSGR